MAGVGTGRFVDAYAVLGVAPDVPQETLKRAHRTLVRRHHPDLAPPPRREAATRRVQHINVAYGLVHDPRARAEYDRLRRSHVARERMAAPARAAGRHAFAADRAAAAAWDVAMAAAGRWAGTWWQRNRRRLRASAARAQDVALNLVGRVLWLASCGVGAAAGFLGGAGAARLLDAESVLVPLVGMLAGLGVGNRRGWRRRLRLSRPELVGDTRLVTAMELAAWLAAVILASALTLLSG
ncbi:MAG: J domain-containing protein [Egibacteraceae bacterium]